MTKKFLLITAPIIFGIYILCFAQYPGSQITNTNIYTSEEQYVNGFSNTFLGVDYAEPYIAMNPRDPLNIFCPFTYSSYITTNGLDWRKMTIPCGGDPFATFDSLGNLYYSSLNTNMNYMLRKSTDKGATWNIDYILAPWADKECIHSVKSGGTYSNYVYTSWALSNNTTVFARSTNLGVNWSNVNMGNVGYPTYLTSGPSITYPNGILYMTYNNYSGSMGYIKLRKSTDGGVTFLPEIIVTSFVPTPILSSSPKFPVKSKNGYAA